MRYLQSATTSRQRGLERKGNEALSDNRGGTNQLINALPMTEVGLEFGNFMVYVTDMTSRLH